VFEYHVFEALAMRISAADWQYAERAEGSGAWRRCNVLRHSSCSLPRTKPVFVGCHSIGTIIDLKGVSLMDTFTRPSDVRKDRQIGVVAAPDKDAQRPEMEEQRDEAFEATLLRLDQKAAESLVRLVGL
jgi:hypothetical protein